MELRISSTRQHHQPNGHSIFAHHLPRPMKERSVAARLQRTSCFLVTRVVLASYNNTLFLRRTINTSRTIPGSISTTAHPSPTASSTRRYLHNTQNPQVKTRRPTTPIPLRVNPSFTFPSASHRLLSLARRARPQLAREA